MRVALLSGNAPRHNAVGNQIAEKVRFFQERGAEVRLFVQDARQLHPDVRSCCVEAPAPTLDGPAWDYLRHADLIIAVYAQHYDLLQYLPALVGVGPRIIFDYLGVTPPNLWHPPNCEGLHTSARQRGYVWCADHALVASQASRDELLAATGFPSGHVTTSPLVVDTQRFQSNVDRRYWRHKLRIDGRVLLYVGRLAGNKRVPLLIEALARLDDPSVHLAIVGDIHDVYADEAARCQASAEQLGVADRVHFTGQLDDAELALAYRDSVALVMPSLHEGFCVPVIEAMASGLPVIASRSTALPETVGDAGLTFVPNDADDLVRQLRRLLGGHRGATIGREGEAPAEPCAAQNPGSAGASPSQGRVGLTRRIAIVSFRFGPDIVGGAETSLRSMAKALQAAGQHVEVFTTCAVSESDWRNTLRPGTATLDGLTVHRYPIDDHDVVAHGEIVRTILEADGHVTPELERRYVEHSIHSAALLGALQERRGELDAIITGPYLFGLTADIVTAFPDQTLLVPCIHDEPPARLGLWPTLFGNVAGILFHSAEERNLAQTRFGINHPNTCEIGACIAIDPTPISAKSARPYVVYCGRYSAQKNVPLLLEWVERYQAEHPGRFDVVFMGQGEIELPDVPWLRDMGRVNEATKRSVLAGAHALVQLSRQESLSLVALEAWAVGTPVIVHGNCAVLAGQVERAQGGVAVSDYATFAAALDDVDRECGERGRAYVATHYACAKDYVDRLTDVIDRMPMPLAEQMQERGLQRAAQFGRERWQQRFAEFIEQVLTRPGRACRDSVAIEPLRSAYRAVAGERTLLLPVRLVNEGAHAAVAEGPGRTHVGCAIHEEATEQPVMVCSEASLPGLLMPAQDQVAALPIALPTGVGAYRIVLWAERAGHPSGDCVEVALTIESCHAVKPSSCASAFLDTVQTTLPKTHQLQQLPDDYIDVTEGRLAPVKRLIKQKMLNNFKHAYVDVLSRQQSQVNGQVVLMIQQLAECCAMLDHAVTGLHQRLDKLEMIHEGPRTNTKEEEKMRYESESLK
jgi:O-antigen biosynthesis protein